MFGKNTTVKPRSEAPEEIFRTAGANLCHDCGKQLYDHPKVAFTDDPEYDQFPIILAKACNGALWKL